MVNFSDMPIQQLLARNLNQNFRLKNGSPKYFLIDIRIDSTKEYGLYKQKLYRLGKIKDSLTAVYRVIKNEREKIFMRRPSAKRTKQLKSTYYELTFIREKKDLSELDYNEYAIKVDSVFQRQTLETADDRLYTRQMDAYLVIPGDILENSYGEYHAIIIGDENEIVDLKRTLQEVVVNQRMEADRISMSLRNRWLKPFKLNKIQISPTGKREYNYYINYFGPIIIVFMLFIAIFTSSGFLFNGILHEKTNRIFELLVSSLSPTQLMAGKIIGLGSLGLVQVFFWIFISFLMTIFKAFDSDQMSFLNADSALLFLVYFILGYFFYASVFVAVAAVFKTEKEAQQVNTFLRLVAIFPILMAILVLNDPQSTIVQYLSYIPFLTPTFMILRVSLSIPMMTDIIISVSILLISIFITIRIAGRLFRVGILWEGKTPDLKMIWSWVMGKKDPKRNDKISIYNITDHTEH